ncbi:MAG: amidohydrolase family protein [Bacteroidota bacterium]|nr:amidohydrolase family protein [Bacteroidota bacterium]
MKSDIQIINCHTHIFNRAIVPDRFLPAIVQPIANLLQGDNTANGISHFFSLIGKKETALLIKRYNQFLKIGDLKSQLEIFKLLQQFYPVGTKFCVLTMDMEFMKAGKVKQNFKSQLQELATIKRDPAYKDLILPFIFIHPERIGLFSLVRKYIEEEQFTGLKMYPPLGYYPFDERLNQVFAYAEAYGIPITSHCARGGVFYQGAITSEMRKHPITGKVYPYNKNKFFTDIYTDPDNYEYLFAKYPNLKVNLAHFGGFDEWEKYLQNTIDNTGELNWYEKVKAVLINHKNAFSDISYTLFEKDLIPLLNITLQDPLIKDRVLFGTDYYMVEQQASEKEFSINLRASIGEDNYRLIAEQNPKRFLNLNY